MILLKVRIWHIFYTETIVVIIYTENENSTVLNYYSEILYFILFILKDV